MDASKRSCHVYGKTESGKRTLRLARGVLPSAARQLWILIDGQRTLGELSSMLGAEAVERSLEQLETRGYVELVRHLPEPDKGPRVAAPPPSEAKLTPAHAAPRRGGALAVLGVLIAILGVSWPFLRRVIESTGPNVASEPVAAARPPAAVAMRKAPAVKAPERAPLPASSGGPRVPVATDDRAPDRITARTGAVPAQQPAKSRPKLVANPVSPEASAATASPAPALHVRSQVTPEIPQKAKDLGVKSGRVVVILHVDPRGTVERVELDSADPPQMYDQEMQQAFEKWTFDPPGVEGRMTVQVDVAPQ